VVGRDLNGGERDREPKAIAKLRMAGLPVTERRALLRELQEIGTEASIPVLRENLRSHYDNVVMDAVRALGQLGTDDATDAIVECLEMEPGQRISLAALALRKLGSRRAVPAIIRCLETRSGEIRHSDKRTLIIALGKAPHVSEVPVLSAALKDRHYRMRHAAAWALAQIRAPESTGALEAAAADLSWLRGRSARRALRVRQYRSDQG
jgi:HEAT repeat protein